MDIVEILQTIKEDWALLAFFFSMGAAWWQGKAWFSKVNITLDSIKNTDIQNSKSISDLHQKMDHLHDRVGMLERSHQQLHEELHQQEIKLAVLENIPARGARR